MNDDDDQLIAVGESIFSPGGPLATLEHFK